MKKVYKTMVCILLISMLALLSACSSQKTAETEQTTAMETTESVETTAAETTQTTAETTSEIVVVPSYLVEIIGDVYIERNGIVERASENSEVFVGDILSTSVDSSVVLIMGDTKKVTLEPNSIIMLNKNDNTEDSSNIVLVLKTGTFVIDVDEKLNENSSFEIMTPAQITSIRGTVVSVTYDFETQDSEILFFEGFGVVSDQTTQKVSYVAVGQSLKVSEGVYTYSAIDKENLNEANLLYVDANEAIFEECLKAIENSTVDLNQEIVNEEMTNDFTTTSDESVNSFYETESESDKIINTNKGKSNTENPGQKETPGSKGKKKKTN